MEQKKYIKDLEIGGIYKTKHYKKWLIYLGKYTTYTPRYGIKEYYAFVKDRIGPCQFILYDSLHKKFHLKSNKRIPSIKYFLDKLRLTIPEMSSNDKVIDFDYNGKIINNVIEALEYFYRGRRHSIHIDDVYWKIKENLWKYCRYINAWYPLFRYKNFKKPIPIRLREKDYRFDAISETTISVKDNQELEQPLRTYIISKISRLPIPCYVEVKSVTVKFSSGIIWEFNLSFGIHKGLLKINEVTL